MKAIDLDTKIILLSTATFVLAYLLFFPSGWLISDEYSYFNQGLAIVRGEDQLTYLDPINYANIPYSYTPYALGNAFWVAFWIALMGIKKVYVGSLCAVVGSTYLLYALLKKQGFNRLAVLLLFLCPPLFFFGRSLMSSVPSLLIVSLFLYLLFVLEEYGKKWFYLSLLAGLSCWFRETNIILLGGICLIHFIQYRRWFLLYVIGTLIGVLPRILSAQYFYKDPFHYVLAENFHWSNWVPNATVYLIILLIFMPLSLFFIAAYRGRYATPIVVSCLLYVVVYCSYGFNATSYSGFYKGVILMGRFMLPILPVYILSVGWFFRDRSFSKWFKIMILTGIMGVIVLAHYTIHQESEVHKKVSNLIFNKYRDTFILYDQSRTTNIVRYINPMHGSFPFQADLRKGLNPSYMQRVFEKHNAVYVLQTINHENQEKTVYSNRIEDITEALKKQYTWEEVLVQKIKPSLYLQVLKLTSKNGY